MGKLVHMLRQMQRGRTTLLVLAVFIVPALTGRDTALADGAPTAQSTSGIPVENVLSATANPNVTPLLFSQDPTESATVYANAQAFAVQNATACGGAMGASQGGCCPFQPSDGACDDHDPSVTTCADASSYTVTESYISDASGATIGLVETRFSPTCNTNWGRITGFGAFASAVKQVTACRGTQGQYKDSGCTDTDTGTESTRFSDQVYAPTECAFAVGELVLPSTAGPPQTFTTTTPTAC